MIYKRVVIKLGTSVLTGGTKSLNQAQMVEIARQCAQLHAQGVEVVICTSGAIAAGKERLNYPDLPDKTRFKQMLASVGQSRLMLVWERLFAIYGIHVGQILLTRADVEDRRRFLNARDTLLTLLENKIIPIINENDAVATAEIKVGDNDNLSALAAVLSEADLLLMLTDQKGLFTADPRREPDAELIREVQEIDDTLRALAGGAVSGLGTGGMYTKLQAADVARKAGADVVIASGSIPNVILDLFTGKSHGTRFPALESPLQGRKRWIFAGPAPSGELQVDEGAEKALYKQGKSLLPAGIIGVNGRFDRGDTVLIINRAGKELGRGIARYDNEALAKIKGCRSTEIGELLGYFDDAVAIHREDMILN